MDDCGLLALKMKKPGANILVATDVYSMSGTLDKESELLEG